MAERAAPGRAPRATGKSAPEGLPDGRGLQVVVLRARFNEAVVDGLVEGALQALEEMGTPRARVRVVDVPGAFELPLAAQAAARSRRCDAVVALGAVIRGETDHYEHVARAAVSGLETVALEEGVPIGLGVLTVREAAQAQERAAPGPDNKGGVRGRSRVSGGKPPMRRAGIHFRRGVDLGVRGRSRVSGGKPPMRRAGIHFRRA
jgi:6,7-dimethyl-8-ribityllumazine synthase